VLVGPDYAARAPEYSLVNRYAWAQTSSREIEARRTMPGLVKGVPQPVTFAADEPGL